MSETYLVYHYRTVEMFKSILKSNVFEKTKEPLI